MQTLIAADDPEPFDINQVPLWAVPQLKKLGDQQDFKIIAFNSIFVTTEESKGEVVIHIKDEGLHYGILRKSDMNTCPVPCLCFIYF